MCANDFKLLVRWEISAACCWNCLATSFDPLHISPKLGGRLSLGVRRVAYKLLEPDIDALDKRVIWRASDSELYRR